MSDSDERPRAPGFAALLRASFLVTLAAAFLAVAAWLSYRWLA